jgi:hypothetical protein
MITRPTVLILGAGASMPYGFPSANQLKELVYQEFSTPRFDQILKNIFKQDEIKHEEVNKLRNGFRESLGRSAFYSVDAFLEHRQEFEKIGRFAMAYCLLRFEKTRLLFEHWLHPMENPDFKREFFNFQSDGHWYQYLFNQMVASGNPFENNKISIVTFNYDRSLEWYFYNSLKAMLSPTQYTRSEIEQKCIDSLSKIKFIHVYGSLGTLFGNDSTDLHVPYDASGAKNFEELICRAADSIILMRDDRDESNFFQEAHDLLRVPETQIFFLGFGFDETNMKRLFPEYTFLKTISGQCFGTTFGIDHNRKQRIRQMGLESMRVISPKPEFSNHFPNMNIYTFLHDYPQSSLR